jgi:ubiquinone/menaquinone biosynthesis C-methylase UbiE
VCDGHNLPFPSGTFDAVFIQGVLEHVLRPQVIADEVFRVLRDKGMIYCEFPFMQPTHGAAFDFSRLTFTGHRMLWRRFVEIDSGACCGPGMALAHSIQQFARSLLPGRASRFAAEIVAGWCFWWLKYLDEWLVKTPAGLDGASAYYFLGRKTEEELSDAEVIKSYRGAQR